MGKNSKNLVVILAKAPEAGHVKTRLGADIGAQDACRVYRGLAEEVWANLFRAQASLGFSIWLAYDAPGPSGSEAQMRAWLPGADGYFPQAAGDLGDRIRGVFQTGFDAGFATVLIAGTDAPDLQPKHYKAAFEMSEKGLAVVGPCEDGGFYLLSLSTPFPDLQALFADIPWSRETTREALRRNALKLGLRWIELEPLSDVDTLQDLRRIRPDLLAL